MTMAMPRMPTYIHNLPLATIATRSGHFSKLTYVAKSDFVCCLHLQKHQQPHIYEFGKCWNIIRSKRYNVICCNQLNQWHLCKYLPYEFLMAYKMPNCQWQRHNKPASTGNQRKEGSKRISGVCERGAKGRKGSERNGSDFAEF